VQHLIAGQHLLSSGRLSLYVQARCNFSASEDIGLCIRAAFVTMLCECFFDKVEFQISSEPMTD